MQVDFYHLGPAPLAPVLARIAERLIAEGGRLLVVAADEAAIEALDRDLWTYAPDSFLPHGRAAGDGAADQPVLLSATAEAANGARFVALVDGVWRDEALGFERAFHFFDDMTVDAARAAWRSLADREEVERRFWRQDEGGRWSRVA